MALTDLKVKKTKATSKPQKLTDSDGMYLLVHPNGAKYWRLDYRFLGKRKTLAIGVYPDISLSDARERRNEARKLLANGQDPSAAKKARKAATIALTENSFELIAREWHNKHASIWAASHSDKIIRRLERDIFPWLGKKPIACITSNDLRETLQRIEQRGALETAHRAKHNCGQIFRYAIATGRAEYNPAPHLHGALPPAKSTHLAAIMEPKAIGGLLRAIDDYQGTLVTKCALKLAPLVFVRPGELRAAQWSEIDLEKAEWNIPAERMKMRQPLLIPLAIQAVTILRDLHPLTSTGKYVFPSARSTNRPMSDNAILGALRRMGFAKEEMTGHGFRAMARTVLDEVLGVRPDFIEHQLGHAVRDPNGRAYNRTAHLPERRKMMQQWADYLDELKTSHKE